MRKGPTRSARLPNLAAEDFARRAERIREQGRLEAAAYGVPYGAPLIFFKHADRYYVAVDADARVAGALLGRALRDRRLLILGPGTWPRAVGELAAAGHRVALVEHVSGEPPKKDPESDA